MSNVSTEIHVELGHAGEFEIEVIAEVDGDRVPELFVCSGLIP